MSQKIKAPDSKGGSGFVWVIVAILAIAAVVIGFVVVKNSGDDKVAEEMPQTDVNFTVERKDNSVVLASKDVKKDAPVVEIFEDFSCPHCGDLTKADHEDTLKALDDGDVIVHFNFLNFLDGNAPGSSTRGAAVALALADTGNAKAFWNMHSHAMMEQTEVARNWEYEDFANAASAYDVDQSVLDSIRDGSVQESAMPIVEGNKKELEKRLGSVSSPIIFVDGKEYKVKAGPDGQPKSWVPDVVK